MTHIISFVTQDDDEEKTMTMIMSSPTGPPPNSHQILPNPPFIPKKSVPKQTDLWENVLPSSPPNKIQVQGFVKKNGTQVTSHSRKTPTKRYHQVKINKTNTNKSSSGEFKQLKKNKWLFFKEDFVEVNKTTKSEVCSIRIKEALTRIRFSVQDMKQSGK